MWKLIPGVVAWLALLAAPLTAPVPPSPDLEPIYESNAECRFSLILVEIPGDVPPDQPWTNMGSLPDAERDLLVSLKGAAQDNQQSAASIYLSPYGAQLSLVESTLLALRSASGDSDGQFFIVLDGSAIEVRVHAFSHCHPDERVLDHLRRQ